MLRTEQIRPVVLVTRATGRCGGSVLRRIRERGRFVVRAMSRMPGSAGGRALAESGVEVAAGDLDDVETLRNAMSGCYGVFGYVHADAWQQTLNLLDASADAGIGYVVIGVQGCNGSTATADVTRMEGYARSVGVPAAFVCYESRQEQDWADVIAGAFEERVEAMLRSQPFPQSG